MSKEVKKYSLRKLSIGCVSCLVGAMVVFAPQVSAETPENGTETLFRSVPDSSGSTVYVRELGDSSADTGVEGSETNPYKNFSTALNAVSDNGTIILSSDVVWQGGTDLAITKNVTLDGRNNNLTIRGTDLVLDANVTLKDINIIGSRDGAVNVQSIYTGNNTVVFDNVTTNSIDRPNLVVGTKNSSDTDTVSSVTLRNSTTETKFENIIVGGNRPANHTVTIDEKVSAIHGISIQNQGQDYTVVSNSNTINRVVSDSNLTGTVTLNKDVTNIIATNLNRLNINGNISSDTMTGVKHLDVSGRLTTSKELSVETISGTGTLVAPIIENAISAPTISNDLTIHLDSNQDLSGKINKTIINTMSYIKHNVLVEGYTLKQKSDASGYYLNQETKLVYMELYTDLDQNGILDDDEISSDDSFKGNIENIKYIDDNINSYSAILSQKMKEQPEFADYVLIQNAPFLVIYKNDDPSSEIVGFRILIKPRPEDNGKSTIKYKVLSADGEELIGLTTVGEVDKNTTFTHEKSAIAKLPEDYVINNYDAVSTIPTVTEDEHVIVYRADLIGREEVPTEAVTDSHTTEYVANPGALKGTEKTIQTGQDEMTRTTRVYKVVNGTRTDEVIETRSEVIQDRRPEIISKGVKEEAVREETLATVYELDTSRPKETADVIIAGEPKRIRETYHWSLDDTGTYTTKTLVTSDTIEDGRARVVQKGGQEERQTEELEFTTDIVENPNKPLGYRQQVTPGQKGLRTLITAYTIDRNTGVLTPLAPREEVQAPVNEVIEVGVGKLTAPIVEDKPKAELGTSPSTYPIVEDKPKAELGTSPSTYPIVEDKPKAELGTSPSTYPIVEDKPKAELGTSPSTYPTVEDKPKAEGIISPKELIKSQVETGIQMTDSQPKQNRPENKSSMPKPSQALDKKASHLPKTGEKNISVATSLLLLASSFSLLVFGKDKSFKRRR